jgi:hypothetical protein
VIGRTRVHETEGAAGSRRRPPRRRQPNFSSSQFRAIEKLHGTRVITMIHCQEKRNLFGFAVVIDNQ